MGQFLNRTFYTFKPLIPRSAQIFMRRQVAQYKRKKYSHIWPIDPESGQPPIGWKGWPGGKKFAVVLSHDVDTRYGYENCLKLADVEEELGFRSCFNFVPERYGKVSVSLLDELKRRGFGIGVHGLKHDGKLFWSKKIFESRALRINQYLKEWGSTGFTSPAMHHNHSWMGALNIDYSVSVFDTDPFEPQPDGAKTIFPFWVQINSSGTGFTELPYTLPQDSTLFVILREKSIDIWLRKTDWIADKGGMVLLNTHPDYMDFGNRKPGSEVYPVENYINFLKYIRAKYLDQYYHGLPNEIAKFWQIRKQSQEKRMSLAEKPTARSRDNKRRIGVVAYTFYDLDFRVMRYAEALAKLGDHVDVIALRNPAQSYHEVINGVHIYRVQGRLINEKGKFSYLHRISKFLFLSGFLLGRLHLKLQI